jgi:hypothetical protein
MTTPSDNETWIIEAGDDAIQKKANSGISSLTQLEKLIICVWAADYGMRNAGDLETANDVHPNFQREACTLARGLSLPYTLETFSMKESELASNYFDRFDGVCEELKNA